jgi:hypothetical protein
LEENWGTPVKVEVKCFAFERSVAINFEFDTSKIVFTGFLLTSENGVFIEAAF